MAKFTSVKRINSRWRNQDFLGNENSSFSIPDEMYDEFTSDWSYEIDRGDIVITETPTTGNIQVATLTVGDIVLTGTATGSFGAGGGSSTTVVGTSPIAVSTAGNTATVSLSASYSTSTHDHTGVYQVSGSYSTSTHDHTGVYQAAGSYQPAGTYVTSVSGTTPISATGTTSATISISSGTAPNTYVLGADGTGGVGWIAQTGGTGGGAPLSSTAAVALGTAAAGTSTDASRQDHVHPTTGVSLTSHDHSGTYEPVNTAILKTIVDAKGDLIVATAADTVARLPVSVTTGHVLSVDPAEATGLKWVAQTGGGITAASTDTLENKTVNLTSNTLSGTLAQFNTAVSDADLVSIAGTETLTGKTLTLPSINNVNGDYTTTVGSATSITLTSSSTLRQFVTGNASQTVAFPDTSTLTLGHSFVINNNMTSLSITLRTNTAVQIGGSLSSGLSARVTCVSTADNTAAAWDLEVIGSGSSTGTGASVFGSSPTITSPSITSPTISSLPYLSGGVRLNYTSVASAAGTTTLSTSANILLTITGTTTQTVATPATNSTGQFWIVRNDSTGNVTVQTSAAALLATLTTGQAVMLYSLATNATTAANFAVYYLPNSATASNSVTFNQQTGTTYSVAASDKDKVVELSNAAAITLTVPQGLLATGDQITIMQTGVGQVTVVGATSPSAVTVNSSIGLKLRAQWSSATLIKRAADLWVLVGDLSA